MAFLQRRKMLAGLVVLVVVLVGVGIVTVSAIIAELDPGDKGDTTVRFPTYTIAGLAATATSLPTVSPSPLPTEALPTPSPPAEPLPIRFFDVSPELSQVDFGVEMGAVTIDGVFPIRSGAITLEPVGDELRVYVWLEIEVDEVTADTALVETVLRGAMRTGDFPLSYYNAASQELVPVTDKVIYFALEGNLQVSGVVNDEYVMDVEAQLIGGDMTATAVAALDLSQHGIELPDVLAGSTITLTARLQAFQIDEPPPSFQPSTQ
ncbi:MAG: hypothetical protein GYB65_10325 [Chloroflexi bacterium]|nr:hypothetical protein [Chloroflexota bacterium]